MTKKKNHRAATPSRRFVEQMVLAEDLLERNQAIEALPILETLHKAQPNDPEVLAPLAQAYHDLHDLEGYERALRRLFTLRPNSPEVALSLAGSYLVNDRPTLALRTFQEYLRRWPGHSGVVEARKAVVALDKEVQNQIDQVGLDKETAKELLLLHEELRFCLGNGLFQQGKPLAEKILRLHPSFLPALNNLGQIYAIDGEIGKAIEIANQVLALQPDNVHALSNLVRLHFLNGQPLEARQFAARLKSSTTEATDRWTKIVEALTFLGDDEGVLELYRKAKAEGLEPAANDVIFYHLVAVSACRLGNKKVARQLWIHALRINQNFEWARQNLADMDKPPGKRHGPWAFPFENWLLGAKVRALARLPDMNKGRINLQKSISQFLEKHPQIIFLAPHMIERGDEKACEFVFRLAAASEHPELLAIAKAFLMGKRGSIDLRMQCAQVLSEAEMLPPGPILMWTGRKWTETMLLNFEIDPEPKNYRLPRQVEKLSLQAWEALNQRDGSRAQASLEQALAIHPEDPHLLNNLAMAYELQGQSGKAHQMIREIHARFPDYFFGIAGMARLATAEGNLRYAHDLLEGLLKRKKIHPSEFTALCMAYIELWLAEDKPEAANTWIEMWESVDPDNPSLLRYRFRAKSSRWKGL